MNSRKLSQLISCCLVHGEVASQHWLTNLSTTSTQISTVLHPGLIFVLFHLKSLVAIKIVNVQDTKHPVSLYIYDAPGDVEQIKEEAVVFSEVDLIFIVLDADNDEHVTPQLIGKYNSYVSRCLAKHCPKVAGAISSFGDAAQLAAVDYSITPLAAARKKMTNNMDGLRIEARKKKGNEDELLTPLHYLTSLNGEVEKGKSNDTEYPKIVYVFTHRDKIEVKGTANEELMNMHIMKLINAGLITKNAYVVSSKIFSDIHLMFKKELQLKMTASHLYKI